MLADDGRGGGSPRPRVLRVITRLNVGGPARQALYLTRELPSLGFECELVTGTQAPGEGLLEDPAVGRTLVPSLGRAVNVRADARAARALTRLVRRRRPDIVHTHMAKAGTLGRLAAWRAGTPVIVHTFHGHVLEGYFSGSVTKAFLEVERRLARLSTALLAVSAATRDELLDLGIGRPEQWRVVPVGLELDELLAPGPNPAEARRSLGLPERGPVVGVVGRLVPIKDHETFLCAASRLARSNPDVTFAIAGDGELRARIESSAQELGVGDRVRFLGWVRDLPALYAALDVVALTSRNEGTPVSLIEAAAAGKPVVATRVGGVPDVVRDGVTGTVVALGNDAAVAAAIGELLSHPGRAAELGAAAREHVRERFSAARLKEEIAGIYRGLLPPR